MEDTLWSSLTDSYAKLPMALTAEKLAEQYGITRIECDEFALSSQQRWSNGKDSVHIAWDTCDKEKVVLPSPNDMAIICIREVVGLWLW